MPRGFLPVLTAGLFAVFLYESAVCVLLRHWVQLPPVPGGLKGQALVFVLFSLAHAFYTLGRRHTLVFFGLSVAIAWTFEEAGVTTGWIYGAYHYTGELGIMAGRVPVFIPLAWFMMLYPSYVTANFISHRQPVGTPSSLGRAVRLSLLSALIMTAWDVALDPVLSGAVYTAWVWDEAGPCFGIPLRNFSGWLLTTFTVFLGYRLFERRSAPRPMGPRTPAWDVLPLAAYGAMAISTSLVSDIRALWVLGPLAMGPAWAAAVLRARRGARMPD